jgi:hypothetical protein
LGVFKGPTPSFLSLAITEGDPQTTMPVTTPDTDVSNYYERNVHSALSRIELENTLSEQNYKNWTVSVRTLYTDVEAIPEIPLHRPTGLKVRQSNKCN